LLPTIIAVLGLNHRMQILAGKSSLASSLVGPSEIEAQNELAVADPSARQRVLHLLQVLVGAWNFGEPGELLSAEICLQSDCSPETSSPYDRSNKHEQHGSHPDNNWIHRVYNCKNAAST
jgi:hypothetical protein